MSMFFSRKSILGATLCAAFLSLYSSCQDEEFGYSSEYIQYKKNFTEVYGAIPTDKCWDLSSYANTKGTDQNQSPKTRSTQGVPTQQLAPGTHYGTSANYWEVPERLLNWMKGHLIEGNDNRHLGSNFFLQLPENDFAIIPIFQGNSAIMSKLEVKINDFQITPIWTKSDNMQADDGDGKGWQNLGYFNGQEHWETFVPGTSYAPYPKHAASTLEAKKVQSKPIIFNRSKIVETTGEGDVYMYLSLFNNAKLLNGVAKKDAYGNAIKDSNDEIEYEYDEVDGKKIYRTTVWDTDNHWTTVGDRLTSINPNGYMLALELPWDVKLNASELPTNYFDNTQTPSEAILVACEDANGQDSDHDINDVVFLIVGYPKAPTIVSTTKTIKKRYLCEDLGATQDFDFNDIVVDVTQTTTHTMTPTVAADQFFNTGSAINENSSVEITGLSEAKTKRQVARISHLCGTLPITAKVGNYLFPWITDPTDITGTRQELSGTRAQYPVLDEGWNPNQEKVISDNSWNPETNNITIYVKWPDNWKQQPANTTDNQHSANNHNNPFPDNTTDFADFANGKIAAATFPENGNVPYIIAVDQDVHWMKECQNIPREWLTNGKFDPTNEGVAGVGSGVFYENWGYLNSEAHVWQGSINSSGTTTFSTVVPFKKGTNSYSDLVEAIDNGYNILHIYYEPVNDAEIGLATEGWSKLSTGDPDGYRPTTTAERRDGYSCIDVALTHAQISSIKTNGLLTTLRSVMKVREITLTKGNSFNVQLAVAGNGKITTPTRVSWMDGSAATVPFSSANFTSAIELTATPANGYNFAGWYSGNQLVSTNNPYSVSANCSLTAKFDQKQYYSVNVVFQENNIDVTEAFGNATITSTNTLYRKNGNSYESLGNSATIGNGSSSNNTIWVEPGTTVTITPSTSLSDYKWNRWPASTEPVRNETINENKCFYGTVTKKTAANLQITSGTQIGLNTGAYGSITWTSESDAEIHWKGDYKWDTEVNIYTNGTGYNVGDKSGRITLAAHNQLFSNKEITIYQNATEEYCSAEVKVYITVTTPIATLIANCWTTAPNKTENGWLSLSVPTGECRTVYGVENNVESTELYDDLCAPVRYLKVNVATGYAAPRFYFNYTDGESGRFIVSVSSNDNYLYSEQEENGTTSYYVDVETIRKEKGKAYLNAIKSSAYDTVIKVNEVVLGIPNN